jgi:cobaltochelatase CobN
LIETGEDAERRTGGHRYRVFGSKPGALWRRAAGADRRRGWTESVDLAEAYLVWGGYAYGAGEEGKRCAELFEQRLSTVQAVVQNQDNREHDLLDSDDYYQFEGGMTAAVDAEARSRPAIYHNDHSRPERPVIRTLEEEIGRVVRARVPSIRNGSRVMRHGYKGAFEMAATVDYMFAFAATTGAVRDAHFDAVYQAYLMDEETLDFIAREEPGCAHRDGGDRLPRRSSAGCGRRRAIRPSSRLASSPDRRWAAMTAQGRWPTVEEKQRN